MSMANLSKPIFTRMLRNAQSAFSIILRFSTRPDAVISPFAPNVLCKSSDRTHTLQSITKIQVIRRASQSHKRKKVFWSRNHLLALFASHKNSESRMIHHLFDVASLMLAIHQAIHWLMRHLPCLHHLLWVPWAVTGAGLLHFLLRHQQSSRPIVFAQTGPRSSRMLVLMLCAGPQLQQHCTMLHTSLEMFKTWTREGLPLVDVVVICLAIVLLQVAVGRQGCQRTWHSATLVPSWQVQTGAKARLAMILLEAARTRGEIESTTSKNS